MLKVFRNLTKKDLGVACVALLLILVQVWLDLTMPKMKKLQTLTDNINRVTRENLNGLRVVRAYNAEFYQEVKLDRANT